jgi:unsaturated rhamnogalacturonyl hydrolase
MRETVAKPVLLPRVILLAVVIFGVWPPAGLAQTSLPDAGAAEEAMRRANDYWIANNNVGSATWNRGAYYTGNHRAFRVLGERDYHDWEVSWGNANAWLIGPEGPWHADAYACGQTYIDLYRMDLQPVYLADIKARTDALVATNAVDGWWWIDAFYMQGPVLARLGNLTGDTNYFNKLWLMYDDMKTRRGLFDPATSLWWRDGSYTNQVTPNGKKVIWSRGNGWVFAGLARVLQQMTTNSPHYADYAAMFQTMAPALKAVQGADGMWRSNLDDYDQYPNPETSGTGFFTYGMAWGVRHGLLPAADYTNTIALAWQGLTNLALQASGRVGWVQNIGAAPGPTTANNTTDFGVGAFLLACSEIYLMATNAPAIRPWAGPDQTVITTNGNPVTVAFDGSQTEIYNGTALSYTWWEGTNQLASGVTGSAPLALGSHVITLLVLGSDSVTYTDSMTVTVMYPPSFANGTWNSDSDGLWGDAAKWLNSTVANGATNIADFSTLNITSDRTVTLETARTIGALRFGDTSGSENWFLVSTGSALTLDNGPGTQPSILVNQNAAVVGARLAGTNGFVKSGPGMLILAGSNTLSGALNLDRGLDGNNDDGATRIAHPDAVGNVSSLNIRNTSVTTAGGATLQLDDSAGSIVITQTITVSCRNNATRATIQNVAGTNTLAGFIALNVGGSNLNLRCDSGLLVFSGTNQYIGSIVGPRNYYFFGNGDFLLNGPILNANNGSTVSVIKSGTGTLRLNATNTYRNGTTVNGGTLLVNGSVTGTVTVASSATLGGSGTVRGPVTVQNGGALSPGDGVGTLTVSNLVLNAGALLRYELGTNSDLTAVASNLTVAGILNITDAGGFGAGTYTLFTYGKTLTYNGLNLGTAPWGYDYSMDTGTVGQVNLVVTLATTAWQQWQWQYFGCTNCPQAAGGADPLGKGISNTNQFLLGLNPTNPASLFRIVSVAPQGDNVVVAWQAGGGRTNVLQAATGNYTNGFVDLPGSTTVLAGSGDVVTNFTDAGGATNGPLRVYRVRFVP